MTNNRTEEEQRSVDRIRRALQWPLEPADRNSNATRFDVPSANCLLDFHGSLQNPDLVLFMAGNQFRALPELLDAFRDTARARTLNIERIFYATTPPGRLIDAMQSGRLATGNFVIDVNPQGLWPDVFMAGAREHRRLSEAGLVAPATRYASNRGAALLVRAGNPLDIEGVGDLARPEVRVAMSSPQREPASFASYAATLRAQGGPGLPDAIARKPNTLYPRYVHHREIPQMLADGDADAAPVYRHIAEYLVAQLPEIFALIPLPETGNAIDGLSVSILLNAPRPEGAEAWREFLLGAAAATILERHGFDCPQG